MWIARTDNSQPGRGFIIVTNPSTSSTTSSRGGHRAQSDFYAGTRTSPDAPIVWARWTWWRGVSVERSACSPSPYIPACQSDRSQPWALPWNYALVPPDPLVRQLTPANQGSGGHRHSPAARRQPPQFGSHLDDIVPGSCPARCRTARGITGGPLRHCQGESSRTDCRTRSRFRHVASNRYLSEVVTGGLCICGGRQAWPRRPGRSTGPRGFRLDLVSERRLDLVPGAACGIAQCGHIGTVTQHRSGTGRQHPPLIGIGEHSG